jgi:very-short-patch-repair endonuclease
LRQGRTHYTAKQLELENVINNIGFQTNLEEAFGPFCADIVIPELGVIIEVDGIDHWQKDSDKRDSFLKENYGIKDILHVSSNIGKREFGIVFVEWIERIFKDDSAEKGNTEYKSNCK